MTAASTGLKPAKGAYYTLSVLFLVLCFSVTDRYLLSILLVPIQDEMQVSDTAMGFLTGLAFAVFHSLAGIPLARVADRSSRRNLIAISIAVWSVLTALQGLARSFASLALARVGVGIGEAAASPSAHSMLSDLFPPERRGTAIAIFTMGGHLGIVVGMAMGGWLNDAYGWRATMIAIGLPGLAVALLVRFSVKEPERGAIEGRQVEHETPSLSTVFRWLWEQHSFRHLFSALPLFVITSYAINTWGPTFMIRVHDMTISEVGLWFGLISGISGAAGTLVGGHVCDRLGTRDMRWYLWLPALAALAAIPFCLGFLFAPDSRLALICLAPMVFLCSSYIAPIYALTQGLAGLRMRAMASAVTHLGSSVLGAGVGPQLIGALNDGLSPYAGDEAIRYSLLLIVITNAWGALHARLATRSLREDLARADERAVPGRNLA